MTECHFWADSMLRQRRVRASPAQKFECGSSSFQVLHFFLFSCPLRLSIYIWAICPWNKFDEKEQCEIILVCKIVFSASLFQEWVTTFKAKVKPNLLLKPLWKFSRTWTRPKVSFTNLEWVNSPQMLLTQMKVLVNINYFRTTHPKYGAPIVCWLFSK